jgi:urocanate hydratase
LSLFIVPKNVVEQYENNHRWIRRAGDAKLVVGSQARILFSDQTGRIQIGLAFNEAIRTGQDKGPIILARDHHDVSGTDSPFRETSNIEDGSAFCTGNCLIEENQLLSFLTLSVSRHVGTKCYW